MASSKSAVPPEQLWQEYQKLNQRYIYTTKRIEKLKQELDRLSEGNWKQIMVKSLHGIRNEIKQYQEKDTKLSSSNQRLTAEISDYKKEVDKLSKQRAQLQSKK